MLSGSITKGLIAICAPVMIMNVIQSLFNIIDMTVLKTYGGAVGAVGVCGTLISLITGLVIGVSSGSNVIIARYIGRKDSASVDRAINTAMAFSIAAGIMLVKLFNLFSKQKINPLIGATGLSAVPMASRVANEIATKYDSKNHVLNYCMASNISGVIGSAVAAGILISMLG